MKYNTEIEVSNCFLIAVKFLGYKTIKPKIYKIKYAPKK